MVGLVVGVVEVVVKVVAEVEEVEVSVSRDRTSRRLSTSSAAAPNHLKA